MEELKQRLNRVKRLMANEDFLKTKKEIDAELGLGQPSAALMKAGIDPAVLGILCGMRDYSLHLDNLAIMLESQIEQQKNEEKIDE